MKRIIFLSVTLVILLIIFIFALNNTYRNGTYSGISRSIYTSEEFYGISKLTIEKDQITQVSFKIVDSLNHELFDGTYEKHFTGNPEYIQQCRENWAAMQKFSEELLELQDIEKVDAVSGATWAHNIFTASVKDALKEAKK